VKWFPDRRGLGSGSPPVSFGAGAALTVIQIRLVIETGIVISSREPRRRRPLWAEGFEMTAPWSITCFRGGWRLNGRVASVQRSADKRTASLWCRKTRTRLRRNG